MVVKFDLGGERKRPDRAKAWGQKWGYTIHVTYSEMRFRLGSACFSFAVRDVTS